jgi:hypothetical protein
MEPSNADRILAGWDSFSRRVRNPGLPPRRAVTTALILVVVVLAAGLWFGLPRLVGQPGAQASPSPVEPSASAVEPSASAVEPSASPVEPSASPVEPSTSPVGSWGPLAVIPPPDGTDLARNEGTLRITDACVYLEDPGGDLWLLVWPADRTTWSEGSRSITFENLDGSVVVVVDGDRVVLGGGGSSEAESGISGEEWVRRIDWVAPPSSLCSLDQRFFVGVVEL